MFVKASVELTLASSSFSRSVIGLGPVGPGSRPEIGCAAVARAAGVDAGKEVGGAEELPACPPALDCPQTRLTLISRNRASRFSAFFMKRNYRDRPRSMQLILHSFSIIRIDGAGLETFAYAKGAQEVLSEVAWLHQLRDAGIVFSEGTSASHHGSPTSTAALSALRILNSP